MIRLVNLAMFGALVAGSLLAMGCGTNACDEAADVAERCNVPLYTNLSGKGATCEGRIEKASACVVEHSDAYCMMAKQQLDASDARALALTECLLNAGTRLVFPTFDAKP